MDPLNERRHLKSLLGALPRSPRQVNGLFEADTEILKLGPRRWLVSSTDSIGEEITLGLYQNPRTWGWMTVMSSVSDLCASGAEGLGLLLSTQWAFGTEEALQKTFYAGVRQALKTSGIPLLGGDSGSAKDHVFTGVILGQSSKPPLTRRGVRPGDVLVLMGRRRLGAGPALALRFLYGLEPDFFEETLFRPRPDVRLIQRLRPWVRAAIDTSDGLASSVAILAELNGVGFDLHWQDESLFPAAVRFFRRRGWPLPLLWMSDHGDFQTLLCVPAENLARIRRLTSDFVVLGEARKARGLSFHAQGQKTNLPVEGVLRGARDLASIKLVTEEVIAHFRRQNM